MKTNEFTMKILKNVLLLIVVVFSLASLQAQELKLDYKILRTGKDGFQWYDYHYEKFKGSYPKAAFDLNGKQLTCIAYSVLEYKGGYFDVFIDKDNGGIGHAYYSKQGKCITSKAYGFDDKLVDDKYLIFKVEDHYSYYFGIYDLENDRQILDPIYKSISKFEENNYNYWKILENYNNYGLYDLKNEKFVLLPVFNSIGMIKGSNGELFIRAGMDNYHYGIYDISGEEILAPEFEYCDYMGSNLFKFKMNGYMGVMNRDGKIIIPLDRHYTSIDYSRTLKTFTFKKETETAYYKGECNASGVQTSIEKTGTKSKPKQQTQQPKQETKPQQPKQETKPKQETVTPTPQPQPQPIRQPQPMQVWKPCVACGGSGQCHICLGTGHSLQNPNSTCILCNGTGKCTHCAGHGGQNVIEYH